jgi:hypothetical protein
VTIGAVFEQPVTRINREITQTAITRSIDLTVLLMAAPVTRPSQRRQNYHFSRTRERTKRRNNTSFYWKVVAYGGYNHPEFITLMSKCAGNQPT